MPAAPKTVSRVQLGRRIRQLREQTGTERQEITERLGWESSKLSRAEQGSSTLAPAEVDVLVTMFGLDGDDAANLRRMGQEARKRNSYGKTPDWARTFVDWEQAAGEILTYESELIPGLLQTEGYARAVVSSSVVAAEEDTERMVADRVKRQARLSASNPPQLSVVLSEAVLRRAVGGRAVMREQLSRLREIGALPTVTLQVLPFSSGAHPGLGSSFVVLHLEDEQMSTVYLEDLTSADYLDGSKHVRTYRLAFQRLQVGALGEPETAALMDSAVRDLE
ncbi:MAG: helix-turn-helix domain-containing protein [Sciscionella sp.]